MRQFAGVLGLILNLATLAGAQASQDTDRFHKIVRLVESAATVEEAAKAAEHFYVLQEELDQQRDALKRLHGEDWRAYQAAENKLDAPYEPHKELVWLKDNNWIELSRELYQATFDQRLTILQRLSKKSGTDFEMKDDEVWTGRTCGNYDITDELKIAWASRRYPAEALASLRKPAWDGRASLLEALQKTENWQELPNLKDILMKLSSDGKSIVRGKAILMLVAFPCEEVEAIIEAALWNRAADTRAQGLLVAFKLELASMESRAIELVDDPVHEVSNYALAVIGRLATTRGKQLVTRWLVEKQSKRFHVLRAIEASSAVEAVPFLHQLLADKKQEGRSHMLEILAELDPPTGIEEVERALRTHDEDIIYKAMQLAGELRIEGTRPLLQRLLNASEKHIRQQAQGALARLDGRDPDGER